jgi:hypothetical protein
MTTRQFEWLGFAGRVEFIRPIMIGDKKASLSWGRYVERIICQATLIIEDHC